MANKSPLTKNGNAKDTIIQFEFLKSSLTVNPCMVPKFVLFNYVSVS